MSERAHEHYEPGGVSTRYVLLAALGFLLLLGGGIGVLYAVYSASLPNPKPPPQRVFPAPRLEAHPRVELHKLLAQQRKELSGYRWTNSQRTLVAIPIDRAMALIAKRGDKAFAPIASAASATESPSTGAPPVPQLQHPSAAPQTPPTVPSNRAAPAGQVKTPAQPETPKTAPTPLSQQPGLGSEAQSGVKR